MLNTCHLSYLQLHEIVDMHMGSSRRAAELLVLIPVKQMHTGMGDKRGIRPRRICHGDAPPFEDHGCRPGGICMHG